MDGRNKKFILELQKKASVRRTSGLYTIDGPKMAAELETADVENVYVTKGFLSSSHADDCAALLREVPYIVVQDSEMKQMSDTVSPQGILVVARQRRVKGIKAMCRDVKAPFFLILETIQDPGNLGTIIRMSEAAGVAGVIMNRETVDVYSPKVVRSTMGALLRVPFAVVDDVVKAAADISEGVYTDGERVKLYAARLDGAVDYASVDYTGASAVMIGNEAHGLSDELSECADRNIIIPMCGHTESLNAAVAASVISFEAYRQRRMQ